MLPPMANNQVNPIIQSTLELQGDISQQIIVDQIDTIRFLQLRVSQKQRIIYGLGIAAIGMAATALFYYRQQNIAFPPNINILEAFQAANSNRQRIIYGLGLAAIGMASTAFFFYLKTPIVKREVVTTYVVLSEMSSEESWLWESTKNIAYTVVGIALGCIASR